MNPMTPPPIPTAEELEELQDLAWNVVDRAVARFTEARAHAERTSQLLDLDPNQNHWAELEVRAALEAESHLINVILATSPDADRYSSCDLERFQAPVRGVRSGDRTYLVVPDSDRETNVGKMDGPPIMRLVVFSGDPILDMGNLSTFAARVNQPAQPRPTPPPVEPPTPIWLLTVIKAAEDLGEREALRRILAADTPGWLLTIIGIAKEVGEHEALRRIVDVPREAAG